MKKTYKNPSMMVVKVKPTLILAGSLRSVEGATGLGVGGEISSGVANSRGSRFSDDDWEEE
jgi:hypothetical protein